MRRGRYEDDDDGRHRSSDRHYRNEGSPRRRMPPGSSSQRRGDRGGDRGDRDRYDDWANDLGDDRPMRHPSAGRRGGDSNHRNEELRSRVCALEDMVRELKSQNRMLLRFMHTAEENMRQPSRRPSMSGDRDNRDGPRDNRDRRGPPQRMQRRPPRGQSSDEEGPGSYDPPSSQRNVRRAPPPNKRGPPPRSNHSPSPGDAGQERDISGLGAVKNANDLYARAAIEGAPDLPDPQESNQPLKECRNCGRKFNPQAYQTHVKKKICQKKARKVFKVQIVDEKPPGGKKSTPARTPAKPKSKWREERAKLQAAIQAGKQISKAIADGVDIRSLPPPPVDNTPDDRVPCPHCGRKFNETVAERHIPHCKNTKNRPAGPGTRADRGKPVKINRRR